MKLITIKDIDRWGACERGGEERYSNNNIAKLLGGREGLTPLEVYKLKIPAADRLWVVLRPEVVGLDNYRELGRVFARRAVKRHCVKCGVPEVEEWAKGYLSGELMQAEAAEAARAAWAAFAAKAAWGAMMAWAALCGAVMAAGAADHKWLLSQVKKVLEARG